MDFLQKFYQNKNVLVTGGAGFIGSHIAEKLCSYKANVTILDDLSTGTLINISTFCSKINFLAKDITSYKDCLKATKKQDIVFHTAAFTSVPQSVKHPAICEKINVEGTYSLLEACKKNNVQKFIFSSSASVYGEKNAECHEDDTPSPQSPYAKSKLDGEMLCKEYREKHNIETVSLRYFNVYGERQNPNGDYAGAMAKFRHNILHEKPIIFYGTGKQKRDFVPVSKVAEANLIMGALKKHHISRANKNHIFNIASGKSITLLEALERLETELYKKAKSVLFKPAREGDLFFSSANCKKYDSIFENISKNRL